MFDVRALEDLVVRTLEFKTELSSSRMEADQENVDPPRVIVYTKMGSYRDYEHDPGAWTVVLDVDLVPEDSQSRSGGEGTTLLPEYYFVPVNISQGEVRAFYVTFVSAPDQRYTVGTSAGRVYSHDSYLEIMEGAALSGYDPNFSAGEMFESRVFNGLVHYEAWSFCETAAPTPRPTLSPTPIPLRVVKTTVVYSVMLAHSLGKGRTQVFNEVDWTVRGAVLGLLETDPDLADYGIVHGLALALPGGVDSKAAPVGESDGEFFTACRSLKRLYPPLLLVSCSF